MSFHIAGGRAHSLVRRLLLGGACWLVFLGCGRESQHGPTLHTVTIHQLRFDPDSLQVAPGDTVEWLNRDIVPHTATAANGKWDSKTLQPNASWRTVFTAAGVEPYGCTVHTTMTGRIEVR